MQEGSGVSTEPSVPLRYFLWRLMALAEGPGGAEPYRRPLLVFLLPTCLYPFTSCCAHIFSSMSPRARHICYFLDYGALSLYSLGEPCTGGRGSKGRWEGGASPHTASDPASHRLRFPLRCLLHASLLAAQSPAPVLCACRRDQLLPVYQPLLLLPVGSQSPQWAQKAGHRDKRTSALPPTSVTAGY